MLERYLKARKFTHKICEPLETEDFVAQPITDVSPPKWHLGHTTWFFETFVLIPNASGYSEFNKQFGLLFNSYYQTVGERWVRAKRGALTRPTVEQVMAYRAHVDQGMSEFLSNEVSSEILSIVEVGIHHEQQHQELLLYDIKAILGFNPLFPKYADSKSETESIIREMGWLQVAEGSYNVGFSGNGFCYDNELGEHKVHLMNYEIADKLVTNGEYLEFINDDGYRHFGYWLSEGWDWVEANGVKSPEYWIEEDGKWWVYGLNGLEELDSNEPVSHVSFFEADAYARWKGVRLPSEFEWEVACNQFESSVPDTANFIDEFLLRPGTTGGFQFYGGLWEWTESAYRPYPYFKIADGALGEYNGKFMINQMVLRGGSYGTSRDHIRATYRNFFHPHLRWMFSGIRLAKHI